MSDTHTPSATNRPRRLLLLGLAGAVLLAAVASTAYYLLHGRWYESTEDAYANGNVVMITPQVPGTVVEISAQDNTGVHMGQVLLRLDDSDARVALEQADATLARTVRQVRGLYANLDGQTADLAVKRAALERARDDVARRKGLDTTGAVSREEVAHALATYEQAERSFNATRGQLGATEALVDNTTVATHPEVKAAAASVRRAYLDHARSALVASVNGYVTQRNVQLGQHVTPGKPLLSLVPLEQIWVDANFKETQLEHMRIGQPVELRSDLYGKDVTYHGRVASIGLGTGSAMSLLPAQNATGNWIKIVQRVPVRVALDPKELADHPLRIGLSMHAEVDMHDRTGAVLSQTPPDQPAYTTDVYQQQLEQADRHVQDVIRGSLGGAAGHPKKHS